MYERAYPLKWKLHKEWGELSMVVFILETEKTINKKKVVEVYIIFLKSNFSTHFISVLYHDSKNCVMLSLMWMVNKTQAFMNVRFPTYNTPFKKWEH